MKVSKLKKEPSLSDQIRILVVAAIPGTAVAALRLVYEETILTWHEGDQMLGFTTVHVYTPLYLLMLASVCMAHIALLSVLAVSVGGWFKWLRTPRWNKSALLSLCLCIALLCVPYHIWKRATIAVKGPGPQAAQSLIDAAADGDSPTVELLLARGVPVDTMHGYSTALDAACAGDHTKLARFLLSKGADVRLAPDCIGKFALPLTPQ